MFCDKCGKENLEGAMFCEDCGAPFKNNNVPQKKGVMDIVKEKLVLFIGLAALVVLTVVLLIVFLGGGYKKPIKNYFKAMNTGEIKYALKAMPKAAAEFYEEDDEMLKYLEEGLKSERESLEEEYGDDVKISCKVLDKIKIDKDELEDMEDNLGEAYESLDYVDDEDDVKVTKGYRVALKITIKGEDKEAVEFETDTVVYKVNGKWCIG